jgi:hypothetical protein
MEHAARHQESSGEVGAAIGWRRQAATPLHRPVGGQRPRHWKRRAPNRACCGNLLVRCASRPLGRPAMSATGHKTRQNYGIAAHELYHVATAGNGERGTSGSIRALWLFRLRVPGDGAPMGREEYRRFAAQCLKMAKDAGDPIAQATFLHMAEVWARLAEEAAERNGDPNGRAN